MRRPTDRIADETSRRFEIVTTGYTFGMFARSLSLAVAGSMVVACASADDPPDASTRTTDPIESVAGDSGMSSVAGSGSERSEAPSEPKETSATSVAQLDPSSSDLGADDAAPESTETTSEDTSRDDADLRDSMETERGREDPAAESPNDETVDDAASADESAEDDVEPASVEVPNGPIVINEVMYHPLSEDPTEEYVELLNTSDQPVDVSNWCIDGVDACIAQRVIGPGEHLALRRPILEGRLDNGGEELTLLDAAGMVRDHLVYNDDNRWPADADGDGLSLQRRSSSASTRNPGNWTSGPPTPGSANVSVGTPMPVWSNVEHTVSPEPGETIVVTADLSGASTASIELRVGFGGTLSDSVDVSNGSVRIEIPGQNAGDLVRYRLTATTGDGVDGTWPRQGDGAEYTGTVVVDPDPGWPTELPRIQWFMDDDTFEAAAADITLTGDQGYPAVVAIDGEIFDNTTVRVKGGSSRLHPKKKWKFVLPAGHKLDIEGLTPEPVDEFALNSSWVDRSFVRELLAAEIADHIGVPVPLVAPVQVERNGVFFGLYNYVEHQDGSWRDRVDLDDSAIYDVSGQVDDLILPPSNADLPPDEFREIYRKESQAWKDDEALRDLIRQLNFRTGIDRRDWILDHVDIASVVDTIALNALIHNSDYGHKNYRLALDEYGRWSTIPHDFDLSLGREFNNGPDVCGTECDIVGTGDRMVVADGVLFGTFAEDPLLRSLLARRMRELVDSVFDPQQLAERAIELGATISTEAGRDRFVWSTWAPEPPEAALGRLIDEFIEPHHAALNGRFVDQGTVAPSPQTDRPSLEIVGVVDDTDDDAGTISSVALRNGEDTAIDISGFEIAELDFAFRPGSVVAPGEKVVIVHDQIESIPGAFGCCRIVGVFDNEIVDLEIERLTVMSSAGRQLSAISLPVDE